MHHERQRSIAERCRIEPSRDIQIYYVGPTSTSRRRVSFRLILASIWGMSVYMFCRHKELERPYLGSSLFGAVDFNWHYRCRTCRGHDRLVAGKIPSTGCCLDYHPGSEPERDRLPGRRVRYTSTRLPRARAHRSIGEGACRSKSCYRNCFF